VPGGEAVEEEAKPTRIRWRVVGRRGDHCGGLPLVEENSVATVQSPSHVPQLLHKHEVDMRQLPSKASSDEQHGGELSPEDGGRRCQTPSGRPEKMGQSCASWGKRTSRSWAFSRQRESGEGGL
jgi:hypothetical protein